MNITEIIKGYLSIYLNPRSDTTTFSSNNWLFEEDISVEDDDVLIVAYYLFFKDDENEILSTSQISELVFNELNSLNLNLVESFYSLINSFLTMFYLPMQGFLHNQNFIHYKAIAFFQLLSINHTNENDFVREKYIKDIFKQAYMYEYVKLIHFRNGVLFFEKNEMKVIFLGLLNDNNSFIFSETIKFCLSMIDFMENGVIAYENLESIGIGQDRYIKESHYNHLMLDKKPYKYKRIVNKINEMYQYPQNNTADFINRMSLLNFLFLEKDAQEYLIKYINNEDVLNNVYSDIELMKILYEL